MDPEMENMHTRKQLSWIMQTHIDDPGFDVCKYSCVSRRMNKSPHSRHMAIKPTQFSHEKARNSLTKIFAEVVRRNIDKAAIILTLLNYNKDKEE